MRPSLFLTAIAPALVAAAPIAEAEVAAPPSAPHITSLKFSGNGCPNPGDVKSSISSLGDSATFTFNQLKGADTENCQVHLQAQGGSQGYQVALKAIEYKGNVKLSPGSSLDAITTVFWSEKAAATTSFTAQIECNGAAIDDSFTVRQESSLNWSKCTGADGYPGTLNVNHRPRISGNSGSYDIKSATWSLVWRKC